jgi:hypothetical protein
VKAIIYLEGGGDSNELKARCREGFRKLLEQSGFAGKLPRLVACGGRASAYDDFQIAHLNRNADYVAMLIDSEDPVVDAEKPWQHLAARDHWRQPQGAEDDQVLFMTTCMETWIICDRNALKRHYGAQLQETALLSLVELEQRQREAVQDALVHATRNCGNAYAKGRRSFEILGKLDVATLEQHLPAFRRLRRILGKKLQM